LSLSHSLAQSAGLRWRWLASILLDPDSICEHLNVRNATTSINTSSSSEQRRLGRCTFGRHSNTESREQPMLDTQNQGPPCTACGSPMKLTAIEPSASGQDLRTFTCPECKRVQRHVVENTLKEAWSAPKRSSRLH
jgi:hypothetical protein